MELALLLTFVCMVTYAFEITFGLAGTILMLIVMGFFADPKQLVIYSVLPQILVAVIGLVRSPKTVQLRAWARMVGFAFVGTLVGIALFYSFSAEVFRYILATAITLAGIYLVVSPHGLKFGPRTAATLDVTAGVSQGLIGISGPIAMTRLMGTYTDKTQIRNCALAFFLTLNCVRLAGYVIKGSISEQVFDWMLISAPFLVVSLWFANHLHFKTNDRLFRQVVSWVILFGGVSLFLS